MKIYFIQINSTKVSPAIKFFAMYNIHIYLTWTEENFFGDKLFFITVTDQPDGKITMEEKARLIKENFSHSIIKIEDL